MADHLMARALSKRRTWLVLFLLVYSFLLSSSWGVLLFIRSWYHSSQPKSPAAAVLASAAYGCTFGILSAAAAAAIAVPAMLVTWITVVVLLALRGRPRPRLVEDGRRATADIARAALAFAIREGNAVAAACALMSFLFLFRRRALEDDD